MDATNEPQSPSSSSPPPTPPPQPSSPTTPPTYQGNDQPPTSAPLPPSPSATLSPYGLPIGTNGWVQVHNFHDALYWQIGQFAVLRLKLVKKKDISLVDVLYVIMQPARIGNNYFLEIKAADEYKKVDKY
ncbi:extensin-like [Hordeum vulgare]|nr:extensin-like [Hordeum vulgare]